MQPKQSDDNWQLPKEQPSKMPYATPEDDHTVTEPVVTMQPVQAFETNVAEEGPEMSSSPQDLGEVKEEPVHWQATEYIHREKDTLWFVGFGVVVAVLMAAAIFLMDSITFAILVPVMAAALIVYVKRPPRLLDYTLSRQGLHVNDHLYTFAEFRGFGVIHDGQEYSIMLLPVKRFHQGVSVYFPEASGEAIVDMLGARLPMEELHLDFVDQIIRKLRI